MARASAIPVADRGIGAANPASARLSQSPPRQAPRPAPEAVWLRAVRPRQWPKNALLFAAPAAAGILWHTHVLSRVLIAALSFCLLSSGAYLLNDLHDAIDDRQHPVKRHRPIAARLIKPRHAFVVAIVAYVLGLGLLAALGVGPLTVAIAYAVLNFAYTGWLRRIAIADIVAIAAAFVIRAVAGGVVVGVAISPWFLVVVSFAALLVAAAKRYADFCDGASQKSRAVLADYNADFLRIVITAALAVAVTAYCLWAFQAVHGGAVSWREVTVLPLTFALLRYLLVVTGGRGGSPEDILLADRPMQFATLTWLLAFALGPVT
jgi:decaprenyl-phosphate phosphoribosyltransferase